MKSMPKLSHLTTFKEIVYCGSLHETSKKLAISQPTLSRIIKELEEKLEEAKKKNDNAKAGSLADKANLVKRFNEGQK